MDNQNANPPYVSYSTFKNTLDILKEKTVPAVLDASVLSTMSGSSRGAVMAGLRFLGLITDDDKPTDSLRALVKASPEERRPLFKAIVEKKYPTSSKTIIDGTTISLKKGFEYPVSEAIKSKCVSFFIGLARDAGISISTHIDNRVRIKRPNRAKSENGKRKPRVIEHPTKKNEDEGQSIGGEGMSVMPILLGPNNIWKIAISNNYSDAEIVKFTEMIKLALLKGK